MLPVKTLTDSAVLAGTWLNRGLVVNARPNTPLARMNALLGALSTALAPVYARLDTINTTSEERFKTYVNDLSLVSGTYALGEDSSVVTDIHTTGMDGAIAATVEHVRRHIQTARLVVVPIVTDFQDRVNNALKNLAPDQVLNMEVRPHRLPVFLVANSLTNRLATYRNLPKTNMIAGMGLPLIEDNDQLVEMMKTGIATLDLDLQNWIRSYGPSKAVRIWNDVFANRALVDTKGQDASEIIEKLMQDPNEAEVNCLIMYLLAAALYNNPPEGTALGLDTFNDRIGLLRDQAAGMLYKKIAARQNAIESGMLVMRFEGNVCYVYGELYDEFLNSGGSNDVLLGNMLVADRQYRAEAILTRAVEFRQEWQRKSAAIKTTQANRRTALTRQLLVEAFNAQLVASRESNEVDQATFNAIAERFNKILRFETSDAEFNDLNALSLKLICRSRFPNTHAEKILTTMERISKVNPELDVRDAGTYAVIEYVTDWICEQMLVKRA